MTDYNYTFWCLTHDRADCECCTNGVITDLYCADCRQAPAKPPCQLCHEHGCAMGCGDCKMGDGQYCGGDNGERCEEYGEVAQA